MRTAALSFCVLALANGKVKAFVVAEEEATLAWLAQIGTIELQLFLGRAGALEVPTSVVFDLDPGEGASVLDCAEIACSLRERLRARSRASPRPRARSECTCSSRRTRR